MLRKKNKTALYSLINQFPPVIQPMSSAAILLLANMAQVVNDPKFGVDAKKQKEADSVFDLLTKHLVFRLDAVMQMPGLIRIVGDIAILRSALKNQNDVSLRRKLNTLYRIVFKEPSKTCAAQMFKEAA
jgi:hypothetical protein